MLLRMSTEHIDLDLAKRILHNYNEGLYDNVKPVEVTGIPGIDGKSIIDRANLENWSYPLETVTENLNRIHPGFNAELLGTVFGKKETADGNSVITFSRKELHDIGVQLYPFVSFGILNGGSATSYADLKKNSSLSRELMSIYEDIFEDASENATGKAKGITPAYMNPDGSYGPDFIEIKIRALLIENLRYSLIVNENNSLYSDFESLKKQACFPMFQMTSFSTDSQIKEALEKYTKSPVLTDLIERTGIDITEILTGIQPLIAAYTHSDVGRPKQIFTFANGRDGEMLPLPGGHGQNFLVLSEIYRYLHSELGKKFIYITNVDNLGNMPDPVSLAVTAMSGRQAAFDFCFRTPVDVKGGILVLDGRGRLNCADIGPAVSKEEVHRQEESGKKILYNCATGLFSLDYLVPNLEQVINKLPMRFTDQVKDAGSYSQAEQVTWEIIGILDDFLIFGVDKYRRFLAAKLLLESFITSGLRIDRPEFPTDPDPAEDFKATAENLYRGLRENLEQVYGMNSDGTKWRPDSIEKLEEIIRG